MENSMTRITFLFYAEGADKWKYESGLKDFSFDKNIYAELNYVYLKISSGKGKRIEMKNIGDNAVTFDTDVYTAYDIFTEDKYNLLGLNPATIGSGKLWVGEYLSNNQIRDFTNQFNLSNVILELPMNVQISAYGRSDKESKFTLSIDGKTFTSKIGTVSLSNAETTYALHGIINQQIVLSTNKPKISLQYSGTGSTDAWLDYIQVISTQKISVGSTPLFIRHKSFGQNNYCSVGIANPPSGLLAWDVTNVGNVEAYAINSNKVSFKAGSFDKQMLLFTENMAISPEMVGKLSNQNLHGLKDEQLIILYHPNFKTAAEKILMHRQNHNKYIAAAINVEQVFNEFGTGRRDPSAIRNFAKMLYDRNPAFKYLLLLGDGSYDYKQLVKTIPAQNFIPVYETDESLYPVNAFPTDDYYALLSNNEGANLKGALDIRVGRLPVTTADEADEVISKLIRYDIGSDRFGEWRINSGFAADDEDSNQHLNDADDIAMESFIKDPVYNQQKVYLDAFKQENTPGGERYNDATDALNQNLNKGQLTWSYLGHGGPKGLAQERVVKISDIQTWSNINSLSLFVTATCSFAGYDDPSVNSGGELALLNPKGGAIGLLTTTRPVFANDNHRLTSTVYKNLYEKVDGKGSSFGDIIIKSKNATFQDTTGDNTRKFTLLGDPSQLLAVPEHEINITMINDKEASLFLDTLGALDKVTLKGEIRNYKKELVTSFNGEIFVTIYDKISSLKTLGNNEESPITTFKVYKNIIFKGKAKVENGYFTIGCVVPKDINYEIGKCRISMYAHTESVDAAGYYDKVYLGGSSENNISDNTPPKMNLYMNDDKFLYGGITGENPVLFVKLADDFGINITGNSIGHDITAHITGEDYDEEFVLNEYYQASANDFRQGEVHFPLKKLKPGVYTAKVKAWDISNNSVEGLIEFRVVDITNDKLEKVYNYPNPFVNHTEFSFQHDLSGSNIDILITIYTISGKVVKSISDSRFSSGYRVEKVIWDGKDDFGSNLAKGVYLYNIKLNSKETGLRRESGFMKMVKI